MPSLTNEQCVPCSGKEPPLSREESAELLRQLPNWQINTQAGEPRLERAFTFPDFARALAFTDAVGALAEQQGHHPALLTEWGRVTVSWWTHTIHGTHRNDFIMAAKTDAAYTEQPRA